MDNLSVDKNGDIYAASFPQLHMMMKHQKAPFEILSPSTVLRIKRDGKGYEKEGRQGHLGEEKTEYLVEEVLEDDGSVVNGATVAVHDAETGRIFIGGASAPWITICETRGV
jgi:arylesterase/paraoxonase